MSENDIAKFFDDGGPASCKSLRDWFAGKAICGLMADPQCFPNEESAKIAYKVADLMLAERAKGAGQ